MKTSEITAADYQRTMKQVWDIVRGYCSDDEESTNTITMAVENCLYDIENGDTEFHAMQTALADLYIEEDYLMSFFEGFTALNIETDDDEFEEFLDEYLAEEEIL